MPPLPPRPRPIFPKSQTTEPESELKKGVIKRHKIKLEELSLPSKSSCADAERKNEKTDDVLPPVPPRNSSFRSIASAKRNGSNPPTPHNLSTPISWFDRQSSIVDLSDLFEDVKKSRESLLLKKGSYKPKESFPSSPSARDYSPLSFEELGSPKSLPHLINFNTHQTSPHGEKSRHGGQTLQTSPEKHYEKSSNPILISRNFQGDEGPGEHYVRRNHHDFGEGRFLFGTPEEKRTFGVLKSSHKHRNLNILGSPPGGLDLPNLSRAKSLSNVNNLAAAQKDFLSKSQWDLTQASPPNNNSYYLSTSPKKRPTLQRFKTIDSSHDDFTVYHTFHAAPDTQFSPELRQTSRYQRPRKSRRSQKKSNIAFQEDAYYTIQGPTDVTSHFREEEWRSQSPQCYPSTASSRPHFYVPKSYYSPHLQTFSSSSSEDLNQKGDESATPNHPTKIQAPFSPQPMGPHFPHYPQRHQYPHYFPPHIYSHYSTASPYSCHSWTVSVKKKI